MIRKFIKAMAVGISAMMLMSSTLVYAEESSEGSGEPAQSEESSSEENSGDSGSGEESSDNSGDSGEAHQEGGSNESTPAEEPAAETPAAEQPAPETPVNETPAPGTPVTETPAAETPAAAQPAAGTEVTDPAAATTPAATDPAVTDPATGETVVTDPAAAGTVTEGTEPAGDGTVTVPTDTLTDQEKSDDPDDDDSDDEDDEDEEGSTTLDLGGFVHNMAEIGNITVSLVQQTGSDIIDEFTNPENKEKTFSEKVQEIYNNFVNNATSFTNLTDEEKALITTYNNYISNDSSDFTNAITAEERTRDDNPTIEGGYINWSDVAMTTMQQAKKDQDNQNAKELTSHVGWVQKDGYIYIYLEDDLEGIGKYGAGYAGSYSTGNYSIMTDLGYNLIFQLNNDGTVVCDDSDRISAVYVPGKAAKAAEDAVYKDVYGGYLDENYQWHEEITKELVKEAVPAEEAVPGKWEIAIPVSDLPDTLGGISFGFYNTGKNQDDPNYTPYTLSATVDSNVGYTGSTDDIEIDGSLGDWQNYPHALIEYNTAGKQHVEGQKNLVGDGYAAIYSDGDVIKGMCSTTMTNHLKGSGDLDWVKVFANSDETKGMAFRFAAVDEQGNITYRMSNEKLPNGKYKYLVFDNGGWGNLANLSELNPDLDSIPEYKKKDAIDKAKNNVLYGEAIITVKDGEETIEWYIDSAKFAEKVGLAATDIKVVSSKYEEIGPDVVTTAGASSGPVANAGMCLAACLIGLALNKKKLANAVQKAKAEV